MNIEKVFQEQQKIEKNIELNHPTKEGERRIKKKILALLVSLGDCADLWQGYKYWSNDQEPIVKDEEICLWCDGTGITSCGGHCDKCIDGYVVTSNPLLLSYTNCLNAILSIGIHIRYSIFTTTKEHDYKESTIEEQFLRVMDYAAGMREDDYFKQLMHSFIYLGEMLGFTQEQIVETYYEKIPSRYIDDKNYKENV